jgi:uncharacterized membrane protein YccC
VHDRFRNRLARGRDRLLASDPGLGRLGTAVSATVAMGTSLAVEYAFALVTQASPQGSLVAMLIGAVVAMTGSMALTGPERWRKVRVAVFFPVAIGVGLTLGTAVGRHTDLMLAVFCLVMFAAVFVRRFGVPFFFYGFMAWMGYFFASFLQTDLAMLPGIVAAVVVASAWVLLLSVTVLRTNPRRVMRATMAAYRARSREVARACAELLRTSGSDAARRSRWERRLRARQAGLTEAALMMEAWSEEPGALAEGWSGSALRRRLLDLHQTLDRLAAATLALACRDPGLVDAAAETVARLAARDDRAATAAAERLAVLSRQAEREDAPGWWAARHLAVAVLEFLDLTSRSQEPPEVEPTDEEYEPTTELMLGNLPGSPSVAREVPARGGRWNPLTRLDMTSRQAVQAALAGGLAILLGRAVSPTRYYWAVIAAFVVFTGTATRSETFVKAVNRVVGTLAGLFAAILLAHVTAGHTGWILTVVLASMFCGFYLLRISYASMIFFVTIMLGQLYSVLHRFSDQLLVVRLEETAVGAAAGIAVALAVTPLSTRDTVRSARDNLLDALAELLEGTATWVEGGAPRPDLDRMSRGLDDRARRLDLVAKPITRTFLAGTQTRGTRHRVGLYLSTASHARALTVALRRSAGATPSRAPAACRALAEAARRLAETAPGRPAPALEEPLARADEALFEEPAEIQATDPVLRPLVHLHGALADLAEIPAALPDRPERETETDTETETPASTRPR